MKHHAFGAAGPLPDKNEAGRLKPTPVSGVHGLGAGDHAARGKIFTQEPDRVSAKYRPEQLEALSVPAFPVSRGSSVELLAMDRQFCWSENITAPFSRASASPECLAPVET
jgi:hypothetical protein